MATRRLYASVLSVLVASAISIVAQGSQAPAERTIAKMTVEVFDPLRDVYRAVFLTNLPRGAITLRTGFTKTDFVVLEDGKLLEIIAFREGTAQAGDPLSPGQYELSVERSGPSDEGPGRIRIGVRARDVQVRWSLSRP